MIHNILKAAQHIVCILDRTLADIVCIINSCIYDCLSLNICLLNYFVCMCISTLHDLMVIDHLVGLCIRLCYHRISLFGCLLYHGVCLLCSLCDHGVRLFLCVCQHRLRLSLGIT